MRRLVLLLVLAGAGCRKAEPPPREVRVPVRLVVGDTAIGCDAQAGPCVGGACPATIHDVRLFVSEVRVVTAGGEVPAALVPVDQHQTADVALLDFGLRDDGCQPALAHTALALSVPESAGDVRELAFTVGVPFALNHQNPALAQAPLTAGSMHWSWRGGYKFLRVEAALKGAGAAVGDAVAGAAPGERQEVRLHLGSTGCEGAIGAITACSGPGRVAVRATVGAAGLVLDLAPLLQVPSGGDGDCMGAPSDPDCAAASTALASRVFREAR